jgi:hypothetical protein
MITFVTKRPVLAALVVAADLVAIALILWLLFT